MRLFEYHEIFDKHPPKRSISISNNYTEKALSLEVSGGLGNQILCSISAIWFKLNSWANPILDLSRYKTHASVKHEGDKSSQPRLILDEFELAVNDEKIFFEKIFLEPRSQSIIPLRIRKITQYYLNTNDFFVYKPLKFYKPDLWMKRNRLWGNFLFFENLDDVVENNSLKINLRQISTKTGPILDEVVNQKIPLLHHRLGDMFQNFSHLQPKPDFFVEALKSLHTQGAARQTLFVLTDDKDLSHRILSPLFGSAISLIYPEHEFGLSTLESFELFNKSKFRICSASSFSATSSLLSADTSNTIVPMQLIDLYGKCQSAKWSVL